jgi:hypothetical protein
VFAVLLARHVSRADVSRVTPLETLTNRKKSAPLIRTLMVRRLPIQPPNTVEEPKISHPQERFSEMLSSRKNIRLIL